MKTCPDCAESVQDAARKCRFCGYRFDAPEQVEPQPEPSSATVRKAPASVPEPPRAPGAAPAALGDWPFLVVALGGALVGIGGVAMGILGVTESRETWLAIAGLGLPCGGLVLMLGWLLLLRTGQVGLGAVLGSAAVPAAFAGAMLFRGEQPQLIQLSGLIVSAGLLFCTFGHLDTLETLGLGGAKVSAQFAIGGLFAQISMFTKQLSMPHWLDVTCAAAGIGGTLLFGFALAIGAMRCSARR